MTFEDAIKNKPKAVPVLYLDLDGTVRKGFDELGKFVKNADDVFVFPEVPDIINKYRAKGYRVVAITNQGGFALGHITRQDLRSQIEETQRQCKYLFDKMLACTHHPDAKEEEFAICFCRKPRIGLVVNACSALNEMYRNEYYPPHMALFVGDREEDKGCAENANIKFMDAKEWRSKGGHW